MAVHNHSLDPGSHPPRIDPKHQVLLHRVKTYEDMRAGFAAAMQQFATNTAPVTLCMNDPIQALMIFALSGDKTRYAFKHWAVHLHKVTKGKVSFVGARELLAQSIGYDCYLSAKQSEVDYTYSNARGPSCLNERFFLSEAARNWFARTDVKIH
jgi:hypothetical protein